MDLSAFPGLPDYGDRRNRCATCGFLALRKPGGTSHIKEADAADRASGGGNWFSWRPYCFIVAADLYKELAEGHERPVPDEVAKTPEFRQHAQAVLDKERDGAYWFPWTPHFSPKEHVEQRNMLYLEQSRRESEERIGEQNRVIAQAIAEATRANADAARSSEKIGQQSLEVAKLSHGHNRKWTIIFAIFAIASFAVAAFYPDGIDVARTTEWLGDLWPF